MRRALPLLAPTGICIFLQKLEYFDTGLLHPRKGQTFHGFTRSVMNDRKVTDDNMSAGRAPPRKVRTSLRQTRSKLPKRAGALMKRTRTARSTRDTLELTSRGYRGRAAQSQSLGLLSGTVHRIFQSGRGYSCPQSSANSIRPAPLPHSKPVARHRRCRRAAHHARSNSLACSASGKVIGIRPRSVSVF